MAKQKKRDLAAEQQFETLKKCRYKHFNWVVMVESRMFTK